MTAITGLPTVYLVDDDPGVLRALSRVLREEGWNAVTFDSAEAFLASSHDEEQACLVLDVTMPGLDGLALQRQLAEAGRALPIVFVTGHGDIPMSVQAMKAGAVDFLVKPVDARLLAMTVRNALAQKSRTQHQAAETAGLRQRLQRLTPREREVLAGLATGKLNKQIAADLGVVEQTVKFHRARLMERMEARTVAELMHIAAKLGIGAVPAAGADDENRSEPGSPDDIRH